MNGQIIPEETEKSIEVKQENATFLVIGDKAYTSEIIEEYNRNAEAKTEDFNTNAENKTASYNSNAADRTAAFNNNYDNKISAFNSNANKQTEEFDSHVLMQTNTFNNNAASTIANYNSNAEQKTNEFNQNALSYQEGIDANKKHIINVSNELERVKNDVLETGTDTDTYIHLEDSAMAEYQELSVDGVCEQVTTSDKNKLRVSKKSAETINGVTFSPVYDKSGNLICINVNGTSTDEINYYLISTAFSDCDDFEPGTYTISCGVKGDGTSYFLYADCSESNDYNLSSVDTNTCTRTTTQISKFRPRIVVRSGQTLNNVKFYPMIEIGNVATSYEPYTGGQPSPRPDYPQPIEVIEDSFNLVSCSKNLYNYKDRSTSQLPDGITVDEEGWITFSCDNSSGTTSKFLNYRTNNLKLKTSTNYSVVAEVKNVSGNGIVYFTSKAWTTPPTEGQFADKFEKNFTDLSDGNVYCKIIKTEEDFSNIVYGLRTYVVFSAGQSGSISFRLSVLEDTSVTANNFIYEPYQSTKAQITVPENEFVGKINDTYKDTLKVEYNEEDGQYHLNLYKGIRKVIFDGSENWNYQNNAFTILLNDIKITNSYEDRGTYLMISNYFLKGETNYRDAIQDLHIAKTIDLNGKQIGIKYSEITSVDDFKTWLSTHNTEVYYAIETPYILDLGVVDMPITYNEVTNLFTDSDLMPTINAKYYRNFITTIQNLQVNEKALKQELVDINSRLSALESVQTSTIQEREVVE